MTIGIIIPSYNRADLVGRTIESVLNQTLLPREILVVDDGSTDETGAVITAFAEGTQGRVRYLHKKNGGLGAARTTGQQNIHLDCDALLFLDSDDLLDKTALAKLNEALEKNDQAALSFCRARFIGAQDEPLMIPNSALMDQPADGEMWQHLLKGNCIRTPGCVLLRRTSLKEMQQWDSDLKGSEDWDMWLRLAETGTPFVCVPEPLLLYRIHGNNMSDDRETMRAVGLRVYEKQLKRHAENAAKTKAIHLYYDACFERKESAEQTQSVILRGESHLSYDAEMKIRHLTLRNWIERIGIAALYRKTPISWRLRLRTLFGIDPNA